MDFTGEIKFVSLIRLFKIIPKKCVNLRLKSYFSLHFKSSLVKKLRQFPQLEKSVLSAPKQNKFYKNLL